MKIATYIALGIGIVIVGVDLCRAILLRPPNWLNTLGEGILFGLLLVMSIAWLAKRAWINDNRAAVVSATLTAVALFLVLGEKGRYVLIAGVAIWLAICLWRLFRV